MTEDWQADFRKLVADAEAYYRSGSLADAAATYRAALAFQPGHGVVAHNLGVVLAAQGDHRSAICCFDAALAADPGYVSAHYNRAVAAMALGCSRDAIRDFSRAC